MRVAVNGTELYFDIEGAGLVPDGPAMRERPTIVALPGGPGFDHAYFKPWLSALADVAQIVYVDLRGQGRSGRPPVETCTLEQMADDVAALVATIGLERPTLLGHSAGGFVALTLAVRQPDRVGRLILVDTAAAIADLDGTVELLEQRQGPAARRAAERVFAGDTSPRRRTISGGSFCPPTLATPRPPTHSSRRSAERASVPTCRPSGRGTSPPATTCELAFRRFGPQPWSSWVSRIGSRRRARAGRSRPASRAPSS